MKFPRINSLINFLRRRESATGKQEQLLRRTLQVRSYSMMRIQEKIVLVARLIDLFQKDYGFVPVELEKILLRLNRDLDITINKSVETTQKLSRN